MLNHTPQLSNNELHLIEELANNVTSELIDELLHQSINESNLGNNPASNEIINTLKPKILSKEKKCGCSICMDTLTPSDKICELDCKHAFHYDCIVNWLKIDNSCPICRKQLKSPQILENHYFLTIFFPDKSILYKSFRDTTKMSCFMDTIFKYTKSFIQPQIQFRSQSTNQLISIDDIKDKTIKEMGLGKDSKISIFY